MLFHQDSFLEVLQHLLIKLIYYSILVIFILEKYKIDYEIDKAYSAKVSSVPTVVLVVNGQEVNRFTGPRQMNEVINFYNQ